MVVLLLFALVAGAATAVTPCVLPVLPALLSASGTGGRRRPLGIVAGLTVTYTITIIGVAKVVDGVGLADGALRTIAIVFLALFGAILLVPPAGQWLAARMSVLSRLGPRSAGDGFWSGLPVGGALGFVYAPCAGPILAAVISVSASQGTTGRLIAVGIAYGLGSAVVLLILSLGGRKLMDRVRRAGRGPGLERALGAVMLLTAVLMFANLDIRFQTALANHFPSFLVNPTGSLERSHAVESRLASLRGKSKFDSSAAQAKTPATTTTPTAGSDAALPGVKTPALPVLGAAPDFTKTQQWFNSKPLTLAALRGRVVLIDFWTYTCINCLRTLPFTEGWDNRYRKDGLTIVGVHTPEFDFEKNASNVAASIKQVGLHYPVVQDNDYGTWNAYGNQYWPAQYLIDAHGNVRYTHFGEGDDDQTEAAIRALLAEAGARDLGGASKPQGKVVVPGQDASPETYIGTARAQGFVPSAPKPGTHDYKSATAGQLQPNDFSLGGRWEIGPEAARAVSGATLSARVVGKNVYLVLSSKDGTPRKLGVLLDGKPITARDAGADVHHGTVTVVRQRLYRLVSVPKTEQHVLTLRFAADTSAFAFTFG